MSDHIKIVFFDTCDPSYQSRNYLKKDIRFCR
jgi:hypothetical protein